MNPGDTLTGTAGLTDSLSISLLNAGAAVGTATAAVAQVNTYVIGTPAAATNTLVVNYGTSSSTIITGATATTAGDALAAAINTGAGRAIAVNAAGTVTVTAPVAGTPLPAITFGAATAAVNIPTVTFTTANVTASGGTISLGNTTGVEVLNITNSSGQAATLDVNGSLPSATAVNNVGSTNATTYTNVGTGVSTIGISNVITNDADVTYTYRTGLTGLADTLTLNVASVQSGTIPVVAGNSPVLTVNGGAAGQGWDIVNVNATGGASRLTTLAVQDGGGGGAVSTMSTLNISGSANFRVEGALTFLNGLGTINASANTGGVNLQVAATETVTFTGGSGNDRINFAGTGFAVTDRVDGGAGVNTLALGSGSFATTDTNLIAAINAATNIQTIEFTNGTQFAANAVSQTNYVFSGAAAALTVDNIAGDAITISGARGANAVDLNAAVGTTALSLTLSNVGTAAGTTSTTDTAGFNTVSIVSNSSNNTANAMSGNFTTNANAVVTITGNAGLTLGTMQAAVVIDGSGAGGILTLTGSGVADQITGGSFADVLAGGAGNDVIVAGAGADAITGGTGADTITTGAGIDTMTVNAADATGDSLLTGVTGALTAANLATFTRAWDIVTADVGDVISVISAGLTMTNGITNNGTTALTMGGALANGAAAYYNDGTNTYLVINTSDAGVNNIIEAADTFIVLTGVRTFASATAGVADATITILT